MIDFVCDQKGQRFSRGFGGTREHCKFYNGNTSTKQKKWTKWSTKYTGTGNMGKFWREAREQSQTLLTSRRPSGYCYMQTTITRDQSNALYYVYFVNVMFYDNNCGRLLTKIVNVYTGILRFTRIIRRIQLYDKNLSQRWKIIENVVQLI